MRGRSTSVGCVRSGGDALPSLYGRAAVRPTRCNDLQIKVDVDGARPWTGGVGAVSPHVVKVDVDDERPLSLAKLVGRLARANRTLVALGQSRSPSGKGWHLWIIVDPAPETAVETVALQLLLGSDPHREAYNLNRARRVDAGEIRKPFDRTWNVFYRKAAV